MNAVVIDKISNNFRIYAEPADHLKLLISRKK